MLAILLTLNLACTSATDVPVAPVRFTPTCGHSVAKIAANPGGAFALWSNVHAGFSMITYWMSGTTLDETGHPRRLAEHTYLGGPQTADIATDGHDFLSVSTVANSLQVQFVDADGTAGDTHTIATDAPKYAPAFVAWNGTAYIVAVATTLYSVDTTGRVVDTKPIAGDPVALSNRFLIVRTSNGFSAMALDGNSVTTLPIPSQASELSTVGDVVVWRDATAIMAMHIGGVPFHIAETAQGSRGSGVVHDGNDELVLWTDSTHVQATRINGQPFRAADGTFASAASTGSGTIVLSQTACNSIASTFVPCNSEPAPRTDVSLAAIAQNRPLFVTTPFGQQVFWSESSAILTAFVASNATISASERVNADTSDFVRYAATRAGGQTYVMWSDFSGGSLPGTLRAARFDDHGRRIDEFEITAAWFFFGLSAASDGTGITVAWTEKESSVSPRLVAKTARIENGAVIAPPVLLSMPDEDLYEVLTATDGASSLISWRRDTSILVSVRLDASLHLLDRRELPAPTASVVFPLAAAINGSESVLVWWALDSDGELRLHVTDGDSDTVIRTTRDSIIDARLLREAGHWFVDSSILDATNTVTLERTDLATHATDVLACAPGEFSYATSGSRVDFMLFVAPQPENEGAGRIFVRRQAPPRRRASR